MTHEQMGEAPREAAKEDPIRYDTSQIEQKPLHENPAPALQQEHTVEAYSGSD